MVSAVSQLLLCVVISAQLRHCIELQYVFVRLAAACHLLHRANLHWSALDTPRQLLSDHACLLPDCVLEVMEFYNCMTHKAIPLSPVLTYLD